MSYEIEKSPEKRKRGRPTRAAASAKALAASIDVEVDPIAILEAIARDRSAPAGARVAACKVLLTHSAPDAPVVRDELDAASRLAVEKMRRLN